MIGSRNEADPSQNLRLARAVRLFVSSTFSDMEAERRVLVERVFPQVREWCHGRGVSFTEIDLRWGITEEQSRAGRVLPICLAEVDACHPFFLGMLGGRYGSSARSFSAEILAEHPWLSGLEERSYTELEFIRGLWNKKEEGLQAMIYERDPSVDFQPETTGSEGARRLRDLKGKVRSSGLMRRAAAYRSAEQLGDWVLEDLTSSLEIIFPESKGPSPTERERNTQLQLLRLRGRRFVGRGDLLDRLSSHVSGAGPPLLLLGPAGGGKSTLLATWVALARREFSPSMFLTRSFRDRLARWRGAEPAARIASSSSEFATVVLCVVGGSPQTSSWSGICRYISQELWDRLSLPGSSAHLSLQAESGFTDLLLAAVEKGTIVLILDGLDQLADSEADRVIASFPSSLPKKLRLIVSAGPSRIADRLGRDGYEKLQVPEWGREERRSCIRAFHEDFGKELSPALEEQMVNGPQNASPIFLQTCLEELRVGASRRELTTRIAEHLSAAGVGELFEQMFARCERNYEAMRPRLVGQLFSFLWAARRGLRESELRELLGTSHEPLPARTWSPVISTLRPHLLQREGLLALTGEAMLKAVSRYYLDSRDDRRAATSTLADYFVRQYPSTRSLEELPWQLLWSGRVGELTSTLVRPVFIAAAWDHDPEDMLTLLATLRFEKIAIGSIFRENHAALSSTLESACAVGQLLFALGENISAEMFVFAAIGHAKLRGDTESVEEFSTTLALIHQRLGKLAEAESRLGQLIDEARAGGRMVQLALHTGNRGAVLREMGRADAALACFLEEEELCRSLGDSSGRSAAIGHLGQIDYDRGHFTEALTRFEDQIMQCRKAGNLRQLQSALGNAAACHAAVDRLEQAMALHGEEEELCRRRGDQEALQVSLGNQVRILQRFRAADYDRAMVLLEEREALAKELGDPAAEAATLLQFSRLYYALNSTQFRAAVSDYAGRAAILADKHGLSKLAAEIALWRSKAISRDI